MNITVRQGIGFRIEELLETPFFNIARIHLNNEYPENEKWKVNLESDVGLVYVAGTATVELHDGTQYEFRAGYEKRGVLASFVPKRVPYRYIIPTKRGVDFFYYATPPWSPNQYKDIPE